MIKAVIFDLDGVLIDSELLWPEAEMKVFHGMGIPLTLELDSQTIGMNTPDTIAYIYQHFNLTAPDIQEVSSRIDDTFIELVKLEGKAKEGVYDLLALCESLGLPLAIASACSEKMITDLTDKLGITDKFHVIQSSENVPYGKPNPAVYLRAAKKLGINPEACLVFEDLVVGVLAAKAANMYCIAVPSLKNRNDKRFGIADRVILSLKDVTADSITSI